MRVLHILIRLKLILVIHWSNIHPFPSYWPLWLGLAGPKRQAKKIACKSTGKLGRERMGY